MPWYVVIRVFAFLARRLPERWGVACARWVGRAIYRVSPVAEANRDNARHVLGPNPDPQEVRGIACQAFENRLLNLYDMLRLPALPLDEISSRSFIEGSELIPQILEPKRGAVVVSPHIGPMEYMIQAVAAYGYPLIGITEHLKPERLHQYIIGLRATHGLKLISTQGSLLEVFRRIKRGEVLLSAVDRDSTETGLRVDLFGAPAWMPDGYARVAVRANVPVLFGYCLRTRSGAKGKLYPPIYPNRALSKEEAVKDIVHQMVRLLEQAIREDPGSWHLSTPVWRLAQEMRDKEAPR